MEGAEEERGVEDEKWGDSGLATSLFLASVVSSVKQDQSPTRHQGGTECLGLPLQSTWKLLESHSRRAPDQTTGGPGLWASEGSRPLRGRPGGSRRQTGDFCLADSAGPRGGAAHSL